MYVRDLEFQIMLKMLCKLGLGRYVDKAIVSLSLETMYKFNGQDWIDVRTPCKPLF